MVSFTLGTVAGLYATSKEVRNGLQGLTNGFLRRKKRDVIDGEVLAERSHRGLRSIGRSVRNRIMASARARIIRKNNKKWQ